MTADHTTLPVLGVLFLATLIRSAFGFGEALVAVPLLALVIPVEVAAPVAVLVSVTVAGLVLGSWGEIGALVLTLAPDGGVVRRFTSSPSSGASPWTSP